MAHTKVVTASAKKGKGKKGKLSHMHIELADNGAVAHTHFMPPAPTDMRSMTPDPTKKVFAGPTAADDLAQHVSSTMFPGGQPAGADDEESGEQAA